MTIPTSEPKKEEIPTILTSLELSEIRDLLILLFQKMGFRIGETSQANDLIYFHLIQQKETETLNILACWTGTRKALDLGFLEYFLKEAPISLKTGTLPAAGVLLSPYEFSEEFSKTAQHYKIALYSGKSLAGLLQKYELTYYYPTYLEIIGKFLWKKLPFILIPLLLLYGFFTYQALKIRPPQNTSSAQPLPENTEVGNPFQTPLTHSSEISLMNPSFEVHVEEPNALYKRFPLEQKVNPNALKPPKRLNPVHVPLLRNKPHHFRASPYKPTRTRKTPRVRLRTNPATSASRIIQRHKTTIDLEEKYFGIAQDLENHHLNTKAKAYYRLYLQRFPDGTHAEEARQALFRL